LVFGKEGKGFASLFFLLIVKWLQGKYHWENDFVENNIFLIENVANNLKRSVLRVLTVLTFLY